MQFSHAGRLSSHFTRRCLQSLQPYLDFLCDLRDVPAKGLLIVFVISTYETEESNSLCEVFQSQSLLSGMECITLDRLA